MTATQQKAGLAMSPKSKEQPASLLFKYILIILAPAGACLAAFAINLISLDVTPKSFIEKFYIPYILLSVSLLVAMYSAVKLYRDYDLPVKIVESADPISGKTVRRLVPFWRKAALAELQRIRALDMSTRPSRSIAADETLSYITEVEGYRSTAQAEREKIRLRLGPLIEIKYYLPSQ
jgi:hypothetical protein